MTVLTSVDAPHHDLGGTRFTSLATPRRGSAETSVWRVEIDPGTPATPHSLTREEVFVVQEGQARVRIGDYQGQADPGDAIVVPPGVEFEVSNGSDRVLRLLCCLPVGGQAVVGADTFTPPWAQWLARWPARCDPCGVTRTVTWWTSRSRWRGCSRWRSGR